MEFVNALSAEEVAARQGAPWGEVPERFEPHFWRQIAGVMVELASIRAPLIGLVAAGSTKSQIRLEPLPDSQSGPYTSRLEFYDDYPVGLGRQCREDSIADGQSEYIELFRAFTNRTLSETLGAEREINFGLANCDLGPHNVLVDDEFNIKAVIDWDALYALPRAAVHFLPRLMYMDCQAPGPFEKDETRDRCMRRGLAFSYAVERVAREHVGVVGHDMEENPLLFTSAEFFSREAIAFRLIERLKFKQGFANEEGITSLKWMEHSSQEQIRHNLGI